MIKTSVTLTWSKILAFVILACSMFLDIRNSGATAFMFALPFVVFLITGKQFFDRNKPDIK